MVNLKEINKIFNNVFVKRYVDIVKCNDTSATRRGEGGQLTLASGDGNGESVPKRHLQDMGVDDDGNHLGYVARIDYPDGTNIDFANGTLNIDGNEYQMGFDTNFKKSNGSLQQNPKGSANELFKSQFTGMNNKDKRDLVEYGTLAKRSSLSNEVNSLRDKGESWDKVRDNFAEGSPGYKLSSLSANVDKMASSYRCDERSIVVGEQVSKDSLTAKDVRLMNTSKDSLTSTSVGFLNDKSINVHNRNTGEVRSVNGQNNNWDNTYKIYTVIPQGSGATGVYLGYAQNVKNGVWDNSGNPHNELAFKGGQNFRKLLVDRNNGIIIQTPTGSRK